MSDTYDAYAEAEGLNGRILALFNKLPYEGNFREASMRLHLIYGRARRNEDGLKAELDAIGELIAQAEKEAGIVNG